MPFRIMRRKFLYVMASSILLGGVVGIIFMELVTELSSKPASGFIPGLLARALIQSVGIRPAGLFVVLCLSSLLFWWRSRKIEEQMRANEVEPELDSEEKEEQFPADEPAGKVAIQPETEELILALQHLLELMREREHAQVQAQARQREGMK
ncbi:hypothetical protein [Paenibacillus herberti]|uniref:Uncharacterized protein n=1 Tax=Paenibacillus herberti TaxID=1619309 RepID=A0A229P053_9BACL|nr:hypothetical protein [Paenibacillus herberti]OXM15249.1 hypothetical protein CGZ75_00430 [Paenibacillus herberti]